MKRLYLFFIFYFSFFIGLWAVPAKPVIVTLTQPDGSELKVRLMGDENYHYYETLDGERLESIVNSQQSTVSGQQLMVDGQQTLKKRRHSSQLFIAKGSKTFGSAFNSQLSTPQRAPHQAERGLVILVEFSDKSFSKTRQNFDDLLNKEGYDYNGATGSARDYFRDASSGKYVPQFDVYGPYKLDKEMSYYGQNDGEGMDKHPDQMVVDAVAKLAAAEDVNFANYDTDEDGYIDNIFIYYAGYGENEGASENTIWPHAWEVYEEYVEGQLVYDGKQLRGYACTSELQGVSGSTMCGIGTFCHEFSHVLGLPDFYVTDYSSSHKTLGNWDIMDSGSYLNNGNTPPTYSAHERFYLGWLTPEILNTAGTFELKELQQSNKAYIITSSGLHNLDGGNPNSATYYLLENRQKTGWDTYLPGHGMMISKTVYDEDDWYNNIPNNKATQQGYDIIEADGKAPIENQGKAGDLFPGSANVTTYIPFTKYPITEIKEVNGVVSFVFMDSTSVEDPDNPDTPNSDDVVFSDCFEETFNGLTFNSSTDITSSIDEYADNAGWDGYKLFCLSGMLKVGSSEHSGYVITPALPFGGDVRVEFDGAAYSANAVISFEIDGYVVSEFEVTSHKDTHIFDVDGLELNSQITIYSSDNRFFIDNFRVCKKQYVAVDFEEVGKDFVIIDKDEHCELIGVSEGMKVRCYDVMGRLMWSKVADNDRFEFVAPQGLYFLQVIDGGKVSIIKGMRN